ncbi:hypothetical protein BDC45DRAFT_510700 [Circinella umbellata]|nr:hypothetical protein BDC45DRAFT_510700 [Circinella umbellata]
MMIQDDPKFKQQPNKIKRLIKDPQFRDVLIIIFTSLALPLTIYYSFRTFTTEVIALVVSGIPPCLRAIYIFIKKRHVDILSCIIVLSFVISGILAGIQGDPKIILLQGSFVTAVIGLMFFLTLVPLSTPWFTIYPMTHLVGSQILATLPNQEWTDHEGEHHEMSTPDFMWQEVPSYRTLSYGLTILWGLGLLTIFAAKAGMIYTDVPVDQIVGISKAVSASVNGVLGGITIIMYFIFRRKFRLFDIQWREENDFPLCQEEDQQTDNNITNSHHDNTISRAS